MFGFAVDERYPRAIANLTSHKLVRRLAELRKSGEISYLRPDAKRGSLLYDGTTAQCVDTAVISTQHDPDVSNEQIHEDVINMLQRSGIFQLLT